MLETKEKKQKCYGWNCQFINFVGGGGGNYLTLKLAGYFAKHLQAEGGGGVVEPPPPKNFEAANN